VELVACAGEAYGAVQGLPDTKVGTFIQELYDEAKKDGWVVVSMKNDWSASSGLKTFAENWQLGARRLLHPHEVHIKGLSQGCLKIGPSELVLLRIVDQRVRATGIIGCA
jgi:hypothetical protein